MTVSSTTVKNSYSGNSSTTVFAYSFKIFADSDLQVIIRSSTGVETTKTLTTHYTVSGAGDASGGNVTFTSGNTPATGETVVIRRGVPQTQAIDYIANDPFPAESHEEGLDRATMTTQQVQEELDRAIKLSRTNTMTSTEFTVGATDRANKVLSFDSSGELSVTQELGTFKGDWSASTAYQVRDLVKDTSTNNIFLVNTAHTSSGSQPLTTNTNSAKYDLIVDAASATTSATAAAASETAASTSETNAATSATNAANSATASETSRQASVTAQTASETARNAAQTAQAAAEAALDNFDDRFLGAKSSDPSVDNDGNALTDGALYFDTTNNVMKVYDLGNTQWRQIQLSTSDQANVNTVAGQISPTNNIATVAGANTNITTLAGLNTEISALYGIRTDISGVNSIAANVTAVKNNETNITAVKNNETNINTLAGISDLGNLATAHAAVTNVSNNLASVNSFANTYLGASGSAPTQDPDGSALDLGDLYFDTGSNQLKVYSSTGWVNAGSSVNGTSDRFKYTISGTPTTVSGNDDNSKSLSYDAGFIDVFLNGIKMVNGTDVTVTSGNSVVFASALTNGDVVDIITFGTFNIASMNASNLSSGTVPSARISGAYTGITQTGTLTSFASTGIDDNATSTAITIDASENVLINTTDTDPTGNNTKGFVFQKDNEAKFSEDGLVLDLNRIGSDGGIIHVRKDGTVVGSIGNKGANIFMTNNSSNNTGFKINPNAITPSTSTGTDRDNAIDLGASGASYKDLYLGGGLYVGGTGTANKLDDYEEGTWTPTYVAGGTNFTSVTYESQVGKYTKIGDTVILTVKISTNAITKGSASGDVYISGLPFTSNEVYSNGTVLYNTANWSGDMPDGWTTFANISVAYLYYKSSTTAVTNINPADMGTGGSANNFIATMIYKTNA
jgi:hypothetical protein